MTITEISFSWSSGCQASKSKERQTESPEMMSTRPLWCGVVPLCLAGKGKYGFVTSSTWKMTPLINNSATLMRVTVIKKAKSFCLRQMLLYKKKYPFHHCWLKAGGAKNNFDIQLVWYQDKNASLNSLYQRHISRTWNLSCGAVPMLCKLNAKKCKSLQISRWANFAK